MKYEYKVVPFIGKLKSGLFSVQNAGDVSSQLQAVINEQASQDWEFVAVNDVNIELSAIYGFQDADESKAMEHNED